MNFKMEELKNSNQFLNIVLDNINSAVFLVSPDRIIKRVNKALENLFSSSGDKLIEELCGNALGCQYAIEERKACGETTHCAGCIFKKTVTKAFEEDSFSQREILKRGFYINRVLTDKFFYFTTKKVSYQGEKVILVVFDDVTEIEDQKRKLEDLNRTKNSLLGMAAHDLRNPIAVIKEASNMLIDTKLKLPAEDRVELLHLCKRMSDFMLNLVDELLDVAKIEAGNLKLEKTENNYGKFVSGVLELNQIFARKKKIDLNFKYEAENIDLLFDKNKIEQVLNNLISNAIKYSFPETKISVHLKKEKDFVLTEVIDEGQGIPEEELHKLFNMFQKTSVRTTAGEKSTGLGIAISKKIVEAHGGTIGALSQVGKGSVFFFRLPLNSSR